MTQTIVQILLLVVSGVAVFTIVVPKFDDIRSTQEETAQYEEALESAFAMNARLDALTNQIDSLSQQERYRLSRLVPETVDPLRLAYDLEVLVERTGMFLISIGVAEEVLEPDPVETTPPVGSATSDDAFARSDRANLKQMAVLPVTITVAGEYTQFKQLLAAIENSAQLLEVQNISFESTGSDLTQYVISVEAYGLHPSSPEDII